MISERARPHAAGGTRELDLPRLRMMRVILLNMSRFGYKYLDTLHT